MPDEIVAHTGTPDAEGALEGIMRHPDIMVIAEADMEGHVYGEDVTIGAWTISTDGLPLYA